MLFLICRCLILVKGYALHAPSVGRHLHWLPNLAFVSIINLLWILKFGQARRWLAACILMMRVSLKWVIWIHLCILPSTGDEMDAQEEGGEATNDANIGLGGSVIRTASPWVRRKRKHT